MNQFLRMLRLALYAVMTGILSFLVFFFVLREYTFLGDVSERTMDISLRVHANKHQRAPNVPRFVFVDIDQQTYAELGYPPVFPRDRLADAARAIAAAEPALLILDVDIGWAGPPEHDSAFLKFLREISGTHLHVLLLKNTVTASEDAAPPVFRKTPFDDMVAAAPNIHWVISEVLPSGDGIVRRAPLFRSGCHGSDPLVAPSAALMGYTLLSASAPAQAARRLNEALQAAALPCSKKGGPVLHSTIQLPGLKSRIHTKDRDHKIHYTMSSTASTRTRLNTLFKSEADSGFKRLHVSPSTIGGRVVIVGSSAPDNHDVHSTPLDKMPGAMIIANHLRALIVYGLEKGTGFLLALTCVTILSLLTFGIWLRVRGSLRRRPILVGELFKWGTTLIWFGIVVIWPLPAITFGLAFVPYLVATILISLHFASWQPKRCE